MRGNAATSAVPRLLWEEYGPHFMVKEAQWRSKIILHRTWILILTYTICKSNFHWKSKQFKGYNKHMEKKGMKALVSM